MSLRKDYLHLHFIVLVWGTTAVLGLLISMPTVEVVFYRTLFASLGLWIAVKLRKTGFLIHEKDYWLILGTGSLIAVHWLTFFFSARISNASVCLAGMATGSLWTALMEPLSLGQKIKRREIALGILALMGMLIICNVDFKYLTGLTVAVFSALLSAFFSVINGKLSKKYDHYIICFYEMIGACITIVLFFPILHYIQPKGLQLSGSVADFLYLGILAMVCTAYAYTASVELLKRMSVFAVNLIVNLEPVYGIILALIIFGEKEAMSLAFYLGTSLILVAVLIDPVLRQYDRQKS